MQSQVQKLGEEWIFQVQTNRPKKFFVKPHWRKAANRNTQIASSRSLRFKVNDKTDQVNILDPVRTAQLVTR